MGVFRHIIFITRLFVVVMKRTEKMFFHNKKYKKTFAVRLTTASLCRHCMVSCGFDTGAHLDIPYYAVACGRNNAVGECFFSLTVTSCEPWTAARPSSW